MTSLAVVSPALERECLGCGRKFHANRRGRPQQYHDAACKMRAFRRRQSGRRTRGLIDLYRADALALLSSLRAETVDFALTDPPYRVATGGELQIRFAMADDEIWPPFFEDLLRVLKPGAHACVFANHVYNDSFREIAASAGFRVEKSLIWDKGAIGLGGDVRDQNEYIVHLTRPGNRLRGNLRNLGTVLSYPRVRGGYSTEKPVALLQRLITHWSQPGDLVLDPFCGSGNVGRAARDLDRRAVLGDVEPGFASRRLRIASVGLRGTGT